MVEYARREASELAAGAVASEHLLLGVFHAANDDVVSGLEALGLTLEAARGAAREVGRRSEAGREIKVALSEAVRAARRDGTGRVGVEHILAGALGDPAGGANAVLRALGVPPETASAVVAQRA